MTLYRCDKCIITVSEGSSIIQCLCSCLCVCACILKKEKSMMCQGEETYGGRQSEAVSRVQPGHIPAVMEDIFYTGTLNISLFDVLSADVRLWVCACISTLFVCMAKERRILKMISDAQKLMFSWAWERRRHLLARLSEHCHVLHWDVNHSRCIGSWCSPTVSWAMRCFSVKVSQLGSVAA